MGDFFIIHHIFYFYLILFWHSQVKKINLYTRIEIKTETPNIIKNDASDINTDSPFKIWS